MEPFLKKLRQSVNHLSDAGHAALHKEIKAAADRHFSGTKDEDIEEWLHTEELHISDFPNDGKPKKGEEWMYMSNEDLRADTDRVMFEVLNYITRMPKYRNNFKAFRAELAPKLELLQLTPTFTLKDLDKMPWDAVHVFHVVLSHNFSIMGKELKKNKILPAKDINGYLDAVKRMDSSYWTFGGNIFAKDLRDCNDSLTTIVRHLKELASTPSRTKIETSEGKWCYVPELAIALIEHIEELLSSI